MGPEAQQLLDRISDWVSSFPPGVVELAHLTIPEDDEYGLAAALALRPSKEGACPIELGMTVPEESSATYIFLDTWSSVARRYRFRITPGQETRVGLYIEPVRLPVETVLEVCRQVAAGAVHLEAVTWAGRLVGTAGYVILSEGLFPMRGIGVPRSLARAAAKLRLLRTQTVRYLAWT